MTKNERLERKEKLIELTERGLYNAEIAVLLGIKNATVDLWKRQLRKSGRDIQFQKGRPKKGREIIRGIPD